MADPAHPTRQDWLMYDPEEVPPPLGVSLLVLNEGGVLHVTQWYDGALAWAFKPNVPESVKARRATKR